MRFPAAVTILCLTILSCGSESIPWNVVLITIDTIRAENLGCYGYFRDTSPNIDRFAKDALLFERCIAPIATTLPSHVSLLTSTYPVEHGIHANADIDGSRFIPSPVLKSYAEVAQEAGYQTAAFVSATPIKKDTGIDAGFDTFNEPDGAERNARETNEAVFRWLNESRRGEKACFLWVHYFDPHAPYEPPPDYQDFFAPGDGASFFVRTRAFDDKIVTGDEWDPATFIAEDVLSYYDNEVRYVDSEVGRLLDRLRVQADWKRTVVVIAGDHGEGLGQHGHWHHGLNWNEQLHVPLIIRVPGVSPERMTTVMSLVDVFPTLFGLSAKIPAGALALQASGVDVLSEEIPSRYVLSESSARWRSRNNPYGRYALTGDRWKAVFESDGKSSLFDLEADPFELNDLHEIRFDILSELQTRLEKVLESQATRAVRFLDGKSGRTAPADEKVRRELEALGYID